MWIICQGPRWEILQLLAESPMTVTAVSKAVFLSMSTTSFHLRTLEESALILGKRVKNRRIYTLSDRIRVARKNDAIQFAMSSDNGQLVLLQTDRNAGFVDIQPVLPDFFIDAELVASLNSTQALS